MKGSWDDLKIALLRRLWDEGHSCFQIATQINTRFPGSDCTRNAVIGKASRLRLSERRSRTAATALPKRSKRQKPKKTPPAHWFPVGIQAEAYDSPPDEIPPPEARVTLADLDDHQCKFPYGDPKKDDFTYCGRERSGPLPYCNTHAKRCYNNVQVMRQTKVEKEQVDA